MITVADIKEAQANIAGAVHVTPIHSSTTLDTMCGCRVALKGENLQRTGSFKIRGASNKMALLSAEEKARGVIAASAGNHAQGVALAAHYTGVHATIVMPKSASFAKVAATRGYGAEVVLMGQSYDEAQKHAAKLAKEHNLTFVHAFDDEAIIAGQGTIGLEIVEQAPDTDIVLVPVGGGGLIAGVSLAIKSLKPSVRVVGVQASAAPACSQSFKAGHIVEIRASSTVADGIAVAHTGRHPFEIIRRHVDDMVTVGDETITQAMVLLLERCKLLVEGAGAVGLAALLEGKVECAGKSVAVLLSGGNIDATLIARVIEHGLADAGRFVVIRVTLLDRPGRLANVLNCLANADANVLDVVHHRKGLHLPLGHVDVELVLETRDTDHIEQVFAALAKAGYLQQPSEGSTVRFVAGDAAV